MSDLIPLDKIVIDERIRRDLGDLKPLAESIRERGLLHPIVLTPDMHLVAGQRRIEAVRLLGWDEIAYTIVRTLTTATSLLKAERDENTCRKEMTPEERKVATDRLLELEKPAAKDRQRDHGGTAPGKPNTSEPRLQSEGRADDIAAKGAGWSRDSYRRATQVIEASEDESLPDDVRTVAKEARDAMNAGTLSVKGAAERVARKKVASAPTKPKNQHEPERIKARVEKATQMAAEGYTSRQIAEALGYSRTDTFTAFKRQHGIEVPADAVVGKTRHIDSNRVVSVTVTDLEGTVMGLKLVDFDALDPEQIEGWTSSLTDSLRFLRQFVNQMKEKVRD